MNYHRFTYFCIMCDKMYDSRDKDLYKVDYSAMCSDCYLSRLDGYDTDYSVDVTKPSKVNLC